jgi:hypothetical protein
MCTSQRTSKRIQGSRCAVALFVSYCETLCVRVVPPARRWEKGETRVFRGVSEAKSPRAVG